MSELVTTAQFRKDAFGHTNYQKSLFSFVLRANTPVICLACTNSNEIGTDCTDGGDMHGTVFENWQYGSAPETPLIEICPRFTSVMAIHKSSTKE